MTDDTCPASLHVLALVAAAPGLLRATLRDRVGVSWARLDALCDRAGVRCHLGHLYPPWVTPPGAPACPRASRRGRRSRSARRGFSEGLPSHGAASGSVSAGGPRPVPHAPVPAGNRLGAPSGAGASGGAS